MTTLQALLLVIAVIAFISGAIILTPIGIIIAAFAIYVWNALYPLLLRIGRWSAQRRNFVPILILAVIIGLVIFAAGLIVYGIFGFSGLSILFFIWLLLLWLLLFGLAALPIGLAIVVWVVRGVRWLWPRYRDSLWSAILMVGGETSSASERLEAQAKHARALELEKRLQAGAARTREHAWPMELRKELWEVSKLLVGGAAAAGSRLAEKTRKTFKTSIIDPLRRLPRLAREYATAGKELAEKAGRTFKRSIIDPLRRLFRPAGDIIIKLERTEILPLRGLARLIGKAGRTFKTSLIDPLRRLFHRSKYY